MSIDQSVKVILSKTNAEKMRLICKKKKISMSALIQKVMKDWLEEYEDMILAKRAEEVDERWEQKGKQTLPHEELWKKLNT